MLVFTTYILPLITAPLMLELPSTGGASPTGEIVSTILGLGPFLHCALMPVFWMRKHKILKGEMAKPQAEEPTTELDPDAKTVIFSL